MTARGAAFVVTLLAVTILLGSLVWGLRSPSAAETTSMEEPGIAPRERIRVEVLNSTGVPGLARRVTDQLRAAGFDVVYYGNASGSVRRDSTTILDRSGKETAIAALADELDVERIESAIDTVLYLEATLVLGNDWRDGNE